MTSKERVLLALNRQPSDRVPINYMANPVIDRRLKEHFGLKKEDDEGLRRALGVDFRGVGAPYTGPRLHAERPERTVDLQWGWVTRYVEHDSGSYWDFCDFPLQEADEETVAGWPLPLPDDFDYAAVTRACREHREYAVHVGHPGLACIMNTAGFLREMERVFLDLARSYNLPVMIHTCGSSSWTYDEYIPMGLRAVDTLQPEAKDMAPAYLKRTFGDRLAFHGCISTAGPVAFGSVADVVADCHRTLEIMMPGGGYCFAPTHALQDNSPTENVLAMYETAHRYGRY